MTCKLNDGQSRVIKSPDDLFDIGFEITDPLQFLQVFAKVLEINQQASNEFLGLTIFFKIVMYIL